MVAYGSARPVGLNARLLSDGARTDAHLPALLVIERRAFWPFQFDDPTQQPLATREPFRTLAQNAGGMPALRQLPGRDLSGYDYVLVMSPDTPLATRRPALHRSAVAILLQWPDLRFGQSSRSSLGVTPSSD